MTGLLATLRVEVYADKMLLINCFSGWLAPRIAAALALALLLSALWAMPAFAESEESSDPGVEESEPAPEPAPETSYTPPAEAREGVGGWAVVDPETGNVHGVTVCTIDVCGPNGSWGGKMPVEYMGCEVGCVLRFQTNAQESGNVAGIHSQAGTSVIWDGDEKKTFSVDKESHSNGGVPSSSSYTLIPEKTMADGRGLESGIVDIEAKATMKSGEQGASVRIFRDHFADEDADVFLEFPGWSPEGKKFRYLFAVLGTASPAGADREGAENPADQIALDVDSVLMDEGYNTTDVAVDEETGAEVETVLVDSGDSFVTSIREVTANVVDFVRSFFGFRNHS